MAIERFEDIVAWQRSMGLCERVYAVLRNEQVGRDRVLADQIWRAAVSVPSNIAEGFERFTRPEFSKFLTIAKASCAEIRCQLQIALRIQILDPNVGLPLLAEATEVANLIGALRTSLTRPKK